MTPHLGADEIDVIIDLDPLPERLDLIAARELHGMDSNFALMHLLVLQQLPFQTLEDGEAQLFLEHRRSLGSLADAMSMGTTLGPRTQAIPTKASSIRNSSMIGEFDMNPVGFLTGLSSSSLCPSWH